ncbi:MAG TPA: Gldg family protein, partial [Gemmata sp.]|nr:Gldg family protein [Gemmata sp.]
MEPTPSPATAPTPIIGQSLVEFIRTQRQMAGNILAGVSVVLLILTAYLAWRAFETPSSEKSADKSLSENLDLEKPPELPKPSNEIANQKRGDYSIGAVASLLGLIVTGIAAAWLFVGLPPASEAKQRSEVRAGILGVGGVLGIIVILAGLLLFYRWSDSLGNWLDKGEDKEARWSLIPLLMAVVGSGLIFTAIQPARAEERNHSLIRKLVYGANFVLTTLLLLVALVVANVLFSLKVPNKLDTTATGFYSISDTTTDLLKRLDQPVTAYAILPREESGDRDTNDIRQLLLACQDASDGKLKVKFLSSATDKTLVNNLRSKYPQLELVLDQRTVRGAVLLATGEDEKRHAVIPDSEFFDEKGQTFKGESRLYKEISFLADSQTKPIIYFTQSNGEMDISGTEGGRPDHTATRLKAYLEKNYLDVRPLTLAIDKPVIPEDATVVVVAEPRIPFTDAAIGAFRKYMTNPTKKGKLIFCSGATAGPDGKIIKTGIEPFLAELNVRLGNQFIYSLPTRANQIVMAALVGFSKSAEQNPILQAIFKVNP